MRKDSVPRGMRMKNARRLVLALFLPLLLAAGGCGHPNFLSEGTPDLPSLSRLLSDSGTAATLERLGYRILSSSTGSGKNAVELEVRRIGDHRTPFSEAEKEEIRRTLYDLVGFKFPLNVTGTVLGADPQMTGIVTAIEDGRFLIVDENKRIGDDQLPDAMWYEFGKVGDSLIRMKDSGKTLTADQVKIGSGVEAWGEGLVLTSYPEQTAGLELNILRTDAGKPALRGTVEEVHLGSGDDPADERYVIVDGRRANLASFTQYVAGDALASADRLKKGDRVEIWDVGYSLAPNSLTASQVVWLT